MVNRYAVIAIVIGASIAGVSLSLNAVSFGTVEKLTSYQESSGLTGHVTLAVYDQDGNVKAYRQTDNAIVNRGENCIAKKTFGVATCTTSTSAKRIAIGTGGTTGNTVPGTNTALVTAVKTKTATVSAVDSSGATASTSKTVVTLKSTFTTPGAGTYKEAGIFDSEGTPNMYARSLLTTAATLGASDNLTITWTVNVGA